jgi:ABC-type uncharacterized transport system ATPase subunit
LRLAAVKQQVGLERSHRLAVDAARLFDDLLELHALDRRDAETPAVAGHGLRQTLRCSAVILQQAVLTANLSGGPAGTRPQGGARVVARD